MARKKKIVNKTNIPEHEIEKIARCLFPDILAFYNSEEGQREFEEWDKARREDSKTSTAKHKPTESTSQI